MVVVWIKWDSSCQVLSIVPGKEHTKFSYNFCCLLAPVILGKITFLCQEPGMFK